MSVQDPDSTDATVAHHPVPPAPAPTQSVPGYTAAPGPSPQDPPRRGLLVALVAACAALVLMFGLAGYLYWTTVQWQREAEALTRVNSEQEQQLSELTAQLEQTHGELEAATDRLLELAGEHAQTADEREMLRQLADRNAELAQENADLARQQNEVAVAASTAAARLSECAAGQSEMLQLFLDGDRVAAEGMIGRVNQDCQTAQQAREALVRLLEG